MSKIYLLLIVLFIFSDARAVSIDGVYEVLEADLHDVRVKLVPYGKGDADAKVLSCDKVNFCEFAVGDLVFFNACLLCEKEYECKHFKVFDIREDRKPFLMEFLAGIEGVEYAANIVSGNVFFLPASCDSESNESLEACKSQLELVGKFLKLRDKHK